MIALIVLLINRLPSSLIASATVLNIILYAIIEAMCALVAAILLMSHLHDKRNAYKHPLSDHHVLVIGLGNFILWMTVAALSFFAIVGHYQRVEVPIPRQDIDAVRLDADGAHATVTVRNHTYEHVDTRSAVNAEAQTDDTVCVKAWFTNDVSAEQMSESVSKWIASGDIDGNMIVLKKP